MKIEKKHEIDASEKDANGYYEYYYEYDDYYFADGPLSLFARSYSDSSEEVSFRAMIEGEKRRMIEEHDMQSPLFKKAVKHLKTEGKSDIQVLTENGYEQINI